MKEGHPDKIYHERVVDLRQLVRDLCFLDGFDFTACVLRGPTVLVPLGGVLFFGDNRGADLDAMLRSVPSDEMDAVEVVAVRDCFFEDCAFEHVAFAGPPEFSKALRQ